MQYLFVRRQAGDKQRLGVAKGHITDEVRIGPFLDPRNIRLIGTVGLKLVDGLA